MVHTRTTRSPSPAPSVESDFYWDNVDSPSPAPSQTADPIGWESDSTPAPVESANATPTPQAARHSSPASVIEISGEDFPPLNAAAPAPATVTKPRAKAAKSKGKKKAVARPVTNDEDDPFLVEELEKARTASLALSYSPVHSNGGASSSRRPEGEPDSPSKRLRANSTGASAPAPFADTTKVAAPAPAAESAPVAVPTSGTPFLAPMNAPAAANALAAANDAPAAANDAPAAANDTAAATYAAVAAAAPVAGVAAAAVLPPLWLTADGLPPRGAYTPAPAGGFPIIWYQPELLLQGTPPQLTHLRDEVDHPKFYVMVSGGNGATARTHSLIRDSLGNRINVGSATFILGTPPTAANGSSPALWLVAGIPANLAQDILDSRVVSSTAITLFPIPYDIPVNGFVGVFTGFYLANTTEHADIARGLLRAAIAANNDIAQFVQTHRDAFGPQVSAGEAWEIFLNSVAVRSIALVDNDITTIDWRLHVTPPTNNHENWAQLRRLFGRLQIMNASWGVARLRRAFRCRICPSVDHPTPLCPLPDVPGWLGPTPATITVIEEAGRAAAAKAMERMRPNNAGGSGSNSGNGRNQGNNKKPFGDGKGKKGNDYKGKGKRRERDDYF
ncbi:hypothetical protein C8J57DRAFT_1724514 [Mycena rebaudengoi]|nr:hypothetical protein C8J57DRAFT_1724514 [Mycena rebaudengoi]